ncbi:hypothetical protein AB3S75_014879 [Citrus x aurantiifolia]
MNHFLKMVSRSCGRKSLIRVVAIAAAGSGLFYGSSNPDSKTRISLSIPATLHESVLVQRQMSQSFTPHSPFISSDCWQFGNVSLVSSRVNPASSGSIKKEYPVTKEAPVKEETTGDVKDGKDSCCRCLGRDTIANAAARVCPAVVNLSAPREFLGILSGRGIGSGAIVDADGTILTCAHVVVDFHGSRALPKGKVDVTLQDGRTFEGTVLNADFHSDIAIVKINCKTPLPAAKLGTSSKLCPGDWVVAMGCPHYLQNTVTAGIVSCVDRKSSDLGLGGMRREYLQTDCAINAQSSKLGNSGGPLVNIDGEIVGVNIMKVAAADGLSFAVPIDSAAKIIEQFKKNGRVVRPWLGLKMLDLNDMIIAQLKERDPSFPNVKSGVLVPVVTPGSPAHRAGFLPSDVVIKFDGEPVQSIKEIIEIMGDRVGEPLKVVVQRANDKLVTLTVIPEEANPDM